MRPSASKEISIPDEPAICVIDRSAWSDERFAVHVAARPRITSPHDAGATVLCRHAGSVAMVPAVAAATVMMSEQRQDPDHMRE
jgi:hypothetical protein